MYCENSAKKLSGIWKVGKRVHSYCSHQKPYLPKEDARLFTPTERGHTFAYNNRLTENAMSFPEAEKPQGKVRESETLNLQMVCFYIYICKYGNGDSMAQKFHVDSMAHVLGNSTSQYAKMLLSQLSLKNRFLLH